MQKIINFNCNGKCVEKYCDNDYKFFTEIRLFDLTILIPLCKKHALLFEEARYGGIKRWQ
jgi:hypothetical protein